MPARDKVVGLTDLVIGLQAERHEGKTIVFTNGCFDLLHAGHLQLLEAAASYGDLLVVGINGDESVRRLKGEDRPIVGASHPERRLALHQHRHHDRGGRASLGASQEPARHHQQP